jgi:hypothetical protein
MKKFVGLVAVLTVALAVVAAPGYAVTGVTGRATADTTILKATVGSTVVKIASDLADSLNSSSIRSLSRFATGYVGSTSLPGAQESVSTKSSENGKKSIGTGTKQIAGLASLNVTSGDIESNVVNSAVTSTVKFGVAQLNALAGFANLAAATSTTKSVVGANSAEATRTINIGSIEVLDLRTLLDQLGIDPLALACGAIEGVGGELAVTGVDPSIACETLSSVTTEITQGNASLASTETAVGLVETALGIVCALAPAGTCDPVIAQINALQAMIDGAQAPNAVPDVCGTLSEALATATGQLNGVLTTLDELTGGVLGDLSGLIGSLTSSLGGLTSATSQLDAVCDDLLGIVDGVLDTPLLSVAGIDLTMDLKAKQSPSSAISGTIGSLKVGNVEILTGSDLEDIAATLQSTINTVNAQLSDVFTLTGLAGLPVPSIKLLEKSKSEGKSGKDFFAKAAMTAVSVAIGSASVDVPAALPLDVLDGLGGFTGAAVKVSAVTTPAVSVQAGVFTGNTTWRAGSTANNSGGGALPTTGVATAGLALSGLLSLAGAGTIRRFIKRH